VCLPLLISPCTIKSRSSLLAPAHPGGPGVNGRKTVVVVVVVAAHIFKNYCSEFTKTRHFKLKILVFFWGGGIDPSFG